MHSALEQRRSQLQKQAAALRECPVDYEFSSPAQLYRVWAAHLAHPEYTPLVQARNQLGTPGGAKSFLRGAQIFKTMSISFKPCPTHFSKEGENFCR